MTEFKTPKGTKLPLLKFKGDKPYLQVAHRIVWFREEHPLGNISTEIIQTTDTHSICRATIYNEAGKALGNGTKREDGQHFKDHLEKAETGAVGRALGLCGFGTQFAPEFDEEERLADSPIAPAKYVKPPKAKSKPEQPTNGMTKDELEQRRRIATEKNILVSDIQEFSIMQFGKKDLLAWTSKEFKDWLQFIGEK